MYIDLYSVLSQPFILAEDFETAKHVPSTHGHFLVKSANRNLLWMPDVENRLIYDQIISTLFVTACARARKSQPVRK